MARRHDAGRPSAISLCPSDIKAARCEMKCPPTECQKREPAASGAHAPKFRDCRSLKPTIRPPCAKCVDALRRRARHGLERATMTSMIVMTSERASAGNVTSESVSAILTARAALPQSAAPTARSGPALASCARAADARCKSRRPTVRYVPVTTRISIPGQHHGVSPPRDTLPPGLAAPLLCGPALVEFPVGAGSQDGMPRRRVAIRASPQPPSREWLRQHSSGKEIARRDAPQTFKARAAAHPASGWVVGHQVLFSRQAAHGRRSYRLVVTQVPIVRHSLLTK